MTVLSILILFFTQAAWCESYLSIGSSQPEQFRADIDDANPLRILIKSTSAEKAHAVKFDYSISDISKFHITYEEKKGEAKAIDMVLVVLSVGNPVQEVKVFAPASSSTIVPSQISPICSLRNYGDFSWENPEELKQKLRVVESGKKTELQIKVKTKDDARAVPQWVHCASIRHISK